MLGAARKRQVAAEEVQEAAAEVAGAMATTSHMSAAARAAAREAGVRAAVGAAEAAVTQANATLTALHTAAVQTAEEAHKVMSQVISKVVYPPTRPPAARWSSAFSLSLPLADSLPAACSLHLHPDVTLQSCLAAICHRRELCRPLRAGGASVRMRACVRVTQPAPSSLIDHGIGCKAGRDSTPLLPPSRNHAIVRLQMASVAAARRWTIVRLLIC